MAVSEQLTIAVGLSGGVDSACAAALLTEQGHRVIGVSMKIYDGRAVPSASDRHACYGPGEEQDIADAAQVAEFLGIPFLVVDLVREYNRRILDFCSRLYASGMTPNPCVYCNRLVKFEGILAELRARGIEVDRFATGHYARVARDAASGRYLLKKGIDVRKDQSYFLYLLSGELLSEILFPLGEWSKEKIRHLARSLRLPVSERVESQDFFAGPYHSLFGLPARPGPIVDESGAVVGRHEGIHRFTIGQRRGLGVAAGKPLYVIALHAERNTVVVGPAERLYRRALRAAELNWIAVEGISGPLRCRARIRYRHREAPATVYPCQDGTVVVRFDQPQRAITPGQAVVFYDGDTVLGGGTIVSVGEDRPGDG